jgi:hypothetical protein
VRGQRTRVANLVNCRVNFWGFRKLLSQIPVVWLFKFDLSKIFRLTELLRATRISEPKRDTRINHCPILTNTPPNGNRSRRTRERAGTCGQGRFIRECQCHIHCISSSILAYKVSDSRNNIQGVRTPFRSMQGSTADPGYGPECQV